MAYKQTIRGEVESINFWCFGSKLTSTSMQVSSVDLKMDKNGINDHSKLIKGKYDGIIFPVIFKQEYGENLTDILDTGWVSLYLISDKLRIILEENSLTGWQIFPVKIHDKNGIEITGYHGFSIIGRCRPTIYDKSELVEKRMVPNGPVTQYYKGLSFDTWDGSDFFTPDKTYQIFITKKAVGILKKNKITNLETENLSEKKTPVSHVRKNA